MNLINKFFLILKMWGVIFCCWKNTVKFEVDKNPKNKIIEYESWKVHICYELIEKEKRVEGGKRTCVISNVLCVEINQPMKKEEQKRPLRRLDEESKQACVWRIDVTPSPVCSSTTSFHFVNTLCQHCITLQSNLFSLYLITSNNIVICSSTSMIK